ncbi:MAG: hypothetical protein QM817_36300 [Archangium sp.]
MTPLEVAIAVARAFERAGIEYFLGGSMATSFQGQPRLTNDLDFVVLLRAPQIATLKTELGAEFDVDEEALAEAVRRKGSWNIFHVPTVTRIDLFVVKDTEYDAEEFVRRQAWEVLPGQRVMLKAPEDSVLRKLLWFQAGGESNSQQFRDVVEVLRVQGERLNVAYLDAWARKLGIAALLARAREAAQLQ